MSEVNKLILEFIKQYPVLIPFAGFIFYYLKSEIFRKAVNRIIGKIFHIFMNRSALAHDLFFSENLFLAQIKRVKFPSKNKTELFQILLEEKIKAALRLSKQFVKDNYKTIQKAHPSEIAAMLLNLIDAIVTEYEKNIFERYRLKYGEKIAYDLFNLIYVNAFRPYHSENIGTIEKRVKRLPFSNSKNTDDILRTFFYKIQDALDDSILDCEEIFESLNGQIDAIINGK